MIVVTPTQHVNMWSISIKYVLLTFYFLENVYYAFYIFNYWYFYVKLKYFPVFCFHCVSDCLNELGSWITTHTSLSPIRRGFAPGFVNYQTFSTYIHIILFLSYSQDVIVLDRMPQPHQDCVKQTVVCSMYMLQ